MRKAFAITYGVGSYAFFLGVYLSLVAFSMNLAPDAVSGPAGLNPAAATAINIALAGLFGVQHSAMARPAFKRWWTRMVPAHLERTTFVMTASATVLLMVTAWQPIEGVVWRVTGPAAMVIYAMSAIGFVGVPLVSFLTDHFHLFGLRQVYEYATGRPQPAPVFRMVGPYKAVRHPMMVAFLIAFWATPEMTYGHLLFASLMTAYILAGIYFEERTLAREHGLAYRDYQARVPKLIPAAPGDGAGMEAGVSR
jgi:protein-S-isoprenylcysteine O-methyltransferase Ste14